MGVLDQRVSVTWYPGDGPRPPGGGRTLFFSAFFSTNARCTSPSVEAPHHGARSNDRL